jgi:hypothetical protein
MSDAAGCRGVIDIKAHMRTVMRPWGRTLIFRLGGLHSYSPLLEMGPFPSSNGRFDQLAHPPFSPNLRVTLITKEDPMPTTDQRQTPSSSPDRLPISSSVGQRRRQFPAIAILVLTAVALLALALVLASALP